MRLSLNALQTGSMHSLVASPYKSAYNAAKHGIAGFTKTVALETAQACSAAVSDPCSEPDSEPSTSPGPVLLLYVAQCGFKRKSSTVQA